MKHIISFILLFSIATNNWANTFQDTLPESQLSQIKKHIQYIHNYPDSLNALNYLYYYRIDLPIDQLDTLFSNLNAYLKNTSKGKELKTDIQWRHRINRKIDDFQLTDTNNKRVYLADVLKSNKYTLIDFWGSWCIPCRNDAPYLISLNKKYTNNNFRIVSISEDVNIKDWLEGIRNDKTNKWMHLVDTKRIIQNDLKIETIPRKLLVNSKLEVVGVYSANFYGKYNLEYDLDRLIK